LLVTEVVVGGWSLTFATLACQRNFRFSTVLQFFHSC
jgi:hypothetical protein